VASRPELFSALVLLDPVIVPPPIGQGMVWADAWGTIAALTALLDGAVTRRNGWGSKYVSPHPPGVILICKFSPGQKRCNRSRRVLSLLLGTHFRWICMLNVSSGGTRKLEK